MPSATTKRNSDQRQGERDAGVAAERAGRRAPTAPSVAANSRATAASRYSGATALRSVTTRMSRISAAATGRMSLQVVVDRVGDVGEDGGVAADHRRARWPACPRARRCRERTAGDVDRGLRRGGDGERNVDARAAAVGA